MVYVGIASVFLMYGLSRMTYNFVINHSKPIVDELEYIQKQRAIKKRTNKINQLGS